MVAKRILSILALVALCLSPLAASAAPGAPSLANNPSLDVVVTNRRPVLSFFNAPGRTADRTYTIQLCLRPEFKGPGMVTYRGIAEAAGSVTAFRLPPGGELKDPARYYWRVRAVDAQGKSGPWAASRFYVDTASDDKFMNLVRVIPQSVKVSSGFNPANIYDLDDPGQESFWQSAPYDEGDQWIELDLGRTRLIGRIWMLSNIHRPNGWLKDFAWQYSHDGHD